MAVITKISSVAKRGYQARGWESVVVPSKVCDKLLTQVCADGQMEMN